MLSINARHYSFGSPMPGRSFSSSTYRYGFNGQEKDDEVTVSGGMNTALFWEYDTRLGRRWNTDPVFKSSKSPYTCFSDNPIIMIDPDGDDDYFSFDGTYLGSDNKKSNNIRMVRISDWNSIVNNPKQTSVVNEEMIKKLTEKSRLLSQMFWDTGNDGIGAAKCNEHITSILKHYFGYKNNQKYQVAKAGNGDTRAYYDHKSGVIAIALNGNGQTNPLLDDADNLISTIKHEKLHPKYGEFDDNSDIGMMNHLMIYEAELMDPNWSKLTPGYQAAVINQLKANLIGLQMAIQYSGDKEYSKKIQAWLDKHKSRIEREIMDKEKQTPTESPK